MSNGENLPSHHIRQELCLTRKTYRAGRHPKAVKVYTVNNESKYILIQGVPCVGARDNLVKMCSKYGEVDEHHALDEYPCEDKYTEVYLFKYKKIQSARFAKRKMDGYSFFGGNLHVCYAPEYETVDECREKINERRKSIASRIRKNESDIPHNFMKLPASVTQSSREAVSAVSVHSGVNSFNSSVIKLSSEIKSMPNKSSTYKRVSLDNNFEIASSSSASSHQTAYKNQGQDHQQTELMLNNSNLSSHPNNSEHQFILPPPPQASFIPNTVRGKHNQSYKSKNNFNRVPSSHATLPSGYDGRIHSNQDRLSEESDKMRKNDTPPSAKHHSSFLFEANPGVKCIQSKIDTNAIVIKDYKKSGSVPKFVPRQAVKRKGEGSSMPLSVAKRLKNEIDCEIRQNAFHLGQVQGPQPIEKRSETAKVSSSINKSMTDTIKSIRTKLSEVIKDSVKKD